MIDVASIVSSLMQVEDQPMNDLNDKIAASNTKISVLGQFQSYLSAVQTALQALQTPSNFTGTIGSSNSSVATATATGNLAAGSYNLVVNQTAQAALTNVSGFSSADAALDGTDYSFTIGGQTYQPQSSDQVTTLSGLANWINNEPTLGSLVQATVVQASAGQYVLSLRGLSTGAANQFTVAVAASTSPPTIDNVQTAQDAAFTVNGINFTRATNTVTDAMPGMTLNLLQAGGSNSNPIVLSPSNSDTTQAQSKLTDLVNSYNTLLDFYNTQTASSADASTRGILNSDFSLQTVMYQLQSALTSPLTDANGQPLKNPSNPSSGSQFMDLLGLEFTSDGHLNLNSTLLSRSPQLPSVLAAGIRIGFGSSSNEDLSQTINDMVNINGEVYQRVQQENALQSQMAQQKVDLQARLDLIQQQYTTQYSALDALLFQLNSTSNALTSSLAALSNQNSN
jgi:flagellar hook-associated protein 2